MTSVDQLADERASRQDWAAEALRLDAGLEQARAQATVALDHVHAAQSDPVLCRMLHDLCHLLTGLLTAHLDDTVTT